MRTLKLIHNVKSGVACKSIGELLKVGNPQRNTSIIKVTLEWPVRQYKDMCVQLRLRQRLQPTRVLMWRHWRHRAEKGMRHNFEVMKGWKTA